MRGFPTLLFAFALSACSSPAPSVTVPETPAQSHAAAVPSEEADLSNTAIFRVAGDYTADGALPLLPEETFGSEDKTTFISFGDTSAVLTVSLSAAGTAISLGIGQNLLFGSFSENLYTDDYEFVVIGEACDVNFIRNDASGATGTFECEDPLALTKDGQVTVTFTGSIDADLYQPAWPLEPGVSEFDDGEYAVGSDIQPGTYRLREPATNCYWERLSGFSGENPEIIENERGNGFMTVTIQETDVGFGSTECGHWTGDLSAVIDPAGPFSVDGIFIVGTDIAPGTWTSTGDPNAERGRCEIARLTGFGGSELEAIERDFAEGAGLTVTIEPTDHGFETFGCGTWTKID